MRPGSITLRLAALFSCASTVVLVLLGVMITRQVDGHFEGLDREVLDGKLQLIKGSLSQVRSADDLNAVGRSLSWALVGHEHLAIAVTREDGSLLYSTGGVTFPKSLLQASPDLRIQSPRYTVTWISGQRQYRGVVAELRTGSIELPRVNVIAAIDIEPHRAFLQAFQRSLVAAIVLGTLLIASLSWVVANRGLKPLREITRVTKAISADRLGDRLPVHAVPIELVELAQALNDMLGRLEDSFRRLSEFSSDIAHELRTPISNAMTQIQVALAKPRTAADYRDVLYSTLEDHERLARMIGDMLYLAKSENGLMIPHREAIDLAAEVRALFSFYDAFVEERRVTLTLTGEGTINGDRLMIHRAVGNLLSNAIRHAVPGGTVAVAIDRMASGGLQLSVENPGADIAAEHLPRLFDRFYRVDPARSHAADGVGLGLAITMSIARAHGAALSAHSSGGLTRFVMAFPGADASPRAPTS